MNRYSAWLTDGSERDYTARTRDSAINRAFKEARKAKEKVVRIDDTTNIETCEECPIIWER